MNEINEQNYLSVVRSATYGSELVTFASELALDLTRDAVEMVCAIYGAGAMRLEASTDQEEGVYRLTYAYSLGSPELTEEEANIRHVLKSCAANKVDAEIRAHAALSKYVRRLAGEYGVKVSKAPHGFFVSAAVRGSNSAYSKIQEAYNRGETKIQFSIHEAKPETIRVYASMLRKTVNERIQTETKGNVVTVWLKPKTKKDVWIERLGREIGLMIEDAGKEVADEVITECVESFFDEPEEVVKIEDWSFGEVAEIPSQHELRREYFQNVPVVHNHRQEDAIGEAHYEAPDPEEDLQDGMPTRMVDGMTQFVIPTPDELDPDDADF